MATVREFNMAGPCIYKGELVRETAKFYVFRDRFDRDRTRKLGKRDGLVHVEPCRSCRDHPESSYRDGYWD